MVENTQQPLLSICIPTYNRAEILQYSLLSFANSVSQHIDKVELIVSDNASTDNTQRIIQKIREKYPFIKSFRNDENIGATFNFFKLSDSYASGKYLWLIGDDDFLIENAVDIVVGILLNEKEDISFVGLNFNFIKKNEINILPFSQENLDNVEILNLIEVLNRQCRRENILSTFISGSIVLRTPFSTFDKSFFLSNWFEDNASYRDVFPHTYIISEIFNANTNAAFITNPIIKVLIHEKHWDNQMATISLHYIVEVFKHFIDKGYCEKKMKRVEEIILSQGFFPLLFKRTKIKYKIYFILFAIRRKSFYNVIMKKIFRKVI